VRRALGLIGAFLAAPAVAGEIIVPSGQLIVPFEVLSEDHGVETWLILRYLAPSIGDDVPYAVAASDIDHLCATEGVEQADLHGAPVDQIVITLMAKPLERGLADPDITQFFGAFRLVEETCILEPF